MSYRPRGLRSPSLTPIQNGCRFWLLIIHTFIRWPNVRVFSDISPTFSREHAEHLKRTFDFFNGLYAKNAGDYYDVYYTTDPEVFLKLNPNPHCHAEIAVDARSVSACYLDYPRWFILPYEIPDFGTQLHEIGHDFHGKTWPLSYDGDPPFPMVCRRFGDVLGGWCVHRRRFAQSSGTSPLLYLLDPAG